MCYVCDVSWQKKDRLFGVSFLDKKRQYVIYCFMSLTRRTENPFERKFSVRERKPLPNM